MDAQVVVQLKNASIYQCDTAILQNVNLKVCKGEFLYLIGRTGEGKSSLLKTLYAELPLQAGKGQVAGFDLNQLTAKQIPLLRRKLGMVFQDFNLLPDRNVHDNLSFVLGATAWQDKHKMTNRIQEVLEWVNMPQVGERMPHQLSGGEKQRVVIARALLNEPVLILADEATGNLDPDTSDEILRLLLGLSRKQDVAIIFATHEYRFMDEFPARILRCHGGQLHEERVY